MRFSNRVLRAVALSDSALLMAALLCVFIMAALILSAFGPTPAQHKLAAAEAKDHIGETATVCGNVASTHYAASTKGHPTFINLDKPYPQQIFTILIWGENRARFGTPEVDCKDKHLCVTGKITEYRGTPEIVADNPRQISTEK